MSPKTLYARLALVLLAIFLVLAVGISMLVLRSARLYEEEVSQRLQGDLASHIASDRPLIENGAIHQATLEALFHNLMVINPSIEVYLLDPRGNILSFSAPPGHVQRQRVDLQPIRRLLAGNGSLPIRGDDPRNLDRSKVFSAAPIRTEDGSLEGYLYVILASEQVDSITGMLRTSQILRTTATVVVLSVLFALLAGLVTFHLLTRRLRRLMRAVDQFRRSDFSERLAPTDDGTADDEIGRLESTIRDMSGRIIDQMNELKRTDALRRELVANVSHDLRTPLASLQGYIETLLLKQQTLSADEQRHCLEIAARHSERLGRLISELFELSKLEANEAKPHFEPCPMGELVQDVVQKYQIRAEQKAIRLRSETPADLPPAQVDIALMERVLQNLIENAIEYTPSGGDVVVALEQVDARLRVSISDTGIGIAEEEIPLVFERFYRSGRRDARPNEGAGLGLAIARKIVELHGCSLEVASQIHRGTTFTFYPPLA